MIPILDKRDTATRQKAVDGDTLNSIATTAGLPDWKAVAWFNWGTEDAAEVARLLFETVGWQVHNDDPGAIVLKPHADADRELLVPKPWQPAPLALDKTHEVKVKTAPQPPVAIRIDHLDRWFVPGRERCDVRYSLEGLARCADRVDVEVFGSNYCSAGAWNDGFVNFGAADLKDTPLYKDGDRVGAPQRGKGLALAEWKGQVSATTGALGTKNPDDEARLINVAFSPYTLVLRYFKDDADRGARLDLDAFWPQFLADGSPVADSLKLRWAVRGSDRCQATQGGGTLQVVDGTDAVVFSKPLLLAELAGLPNGFRECVWDGNYSPGTKTNSSGGNRVIAADMPYRMQVQVHTGIDQANGLALAAMHTEVRLYVNPATHVPALNPYVADTDAASMVLRCHRDLLVTTELERDAGTAWLQQELARAGFHPGPVDGGAHAAYATALREFKRSVPKRKARARDDFARFVIDASEGDDVQDAVEDLATATGRQRPWFGDPAAARANLAWDGAGLSARLSNPADELIVWVDDRHYYTDANWLDSCGAPGVAARQKIINAPEAMANYALTYTSGDAVIDMKATEIPRPWIPLAVTLPLMGKADKLGDTVAAPSEAVLAEMGKALGPLRVDWSFDEIDADPPLETVIDPAGYDSQVSRPKKHVEETRNTHKASHARRDVSKTSSYANCPEAPAGGLRPAALADYYKQTFGHGGADSLAPWRAEPDAGPETIATVVHDNIGQDEDKTFVARLGQAGVYFRPSTMAGDGYRVRAQVRFQPLAGYQFANLAVLQQRYALLPQVQSAKLRVWRKASLRAYINWAPVNNWATSRNGLSAYFKGAYLHFEEESGQAIASRAVTALMRDGSDFRALVRESVPSGPLASKADKERAKKEHIALHSQRLWPWYGAPHFGMFEPSAPNAAFGDAIQGFYDKISDIFCNLSNLYGLAWVRELEKRSGQLRGHTVVEFECGDNFFAQEYACDTCADKFHYVERNTAGESMFRRKCPTPGCAGKLGHVEKYLGHYRCAGGHDLRYDEASGVGGAFVGMGHPGACNAALATVTSTRVDYHCSKCGWVYDFADTTGAQHDGDPCMQGTCEGKMRRPGGAGLFEETYSCRKCAVNVTLAETTLAGGSHLNERHKGCAKIISGKLQRQAPAVVAAVPVGNKVDLVHGAPSGYEGIPVPSIGNPMGVSLNFNGTSVLWAHELSHNRYMEHTGNSNGGPGSVPQHDTEPNTHFNFVGIGETDPISMNWDRGCLMTYADQMSTYDAVRDRQCLCGKCLLKIRGWKVQGIANPAGNVHE